MLRWTCGLTQRCQLRASRSKPTWTRAGVRLRPFSCNGALHVGDSIVTGPAHGRVRALLDDHGNTVDVAPPSFPVQVLGLTAVPGAGDSFLVVEDDRMARQIGERRASRLRMAAQAAGTRRKTPRSALRAVGEGRDSGAATHPQGRWCRSVEALEDALSKIDVGDEGRCGSSTGVWARSPRRTSRSPPRPTR